MDENTRSTLRSLEIVLLNAEPTPLCGSAVWAADIPMLPGVYAVWDVRSRDVVYIGATSCLRDRMLDFGRWKNHTCRRKLGRKLGFDDSDEVALSAALAKRYVLSFVPVFLGRSELEEYLYLRWRETLLNSPPRRLERGTQYRWVKASRPRLRTIGSIPATRTRRDSE